jgi:hypothetical protein
MNADGDKLFGQTWVFPWAPEVFRWAPNNLISDGTFTIMGEMCLEILHCVFANESLPCALAIFPTETAASYSALFESVDQVLIEHGMRDLLKKIPLVSDQGAGLASLVAQKGLTWYLCHRHLIENAGASSIYGEWVSRMLKCCCRVEFQAVAATIREEMKLAGITEVSCEGLSPNDTFVRINRLGEVAALRNVRLMLEEYHVERWGRWHRLLCPSTSNAAESIHAKLNRDAWTVRTFLMRLRLVKKLLFRRFEDRNCPLRVSRRSSTAFLRKKKREEREGIVRTDPGWYEFYANLNRLRCANGPVEGWKFPEWECPPERRQAQCSEVRRDFPVPAKFVTEPSLTRTLLALGPEPPRPDPTVDTPVAPPVPEVPAPVKRRRVPSVTTAMNTRRRGDKVAAAIPSPSRPPKTIARPPKTIARPSQQLLETMVDSATQGWDADGQSDDEEAELDKVVNEATQRAFSEANTSELLSAARTVEMGSINSKKGGNPFYNAVGWDIIGRLKRHYPGKTFLREHITRVFEIGATYQPRSIKAKLTPLQESAWRHSTRLDFAQIWGRAPPAQVN